MDFKIGDRIRIYGVDKNLNPASTCATIANFTDKGLIIVAEKDEAKCKVMLWDFTLPHPKQCRKVKKKEPRRIWVLKSSQYNLELKPDQEEIYKYIEFIEVL